MQTVRIFRLFHYLTATGIVKCSCRLVAPSGGFGNGDARRTAARMLRSSEGLPLDRMMRTETSRPEGDSAKDNTTSPRPRLPEALRAILALTLAP